VKGVSAVVIIPTYNERDNIAKLVRALLMHDGVGDGHDDASPMEPAWWWTSWFANSLSEWMSCTVPPIAASDDPTPTASSTP
jgi:hypothetical protein